MLSSYYQVEIKAGEHKEVNVTINTSCRKQNTRQWRSDRAMCNLTVCKTNNLSDMQVKWSHRILTYLECLN